MVILKKTTLNSFILILILHLFSCKKEFITPTSNGKLGFSTGNVLFDTVFTTIGSTTKYFLIYNPNKNPVSISSIKIGNGQNSFFAMNIDGIACKSTNNIVIPGKDSLFVFVKVTINPTNQNNPLVVKDSIEFITNGNKQYVQLEAWGQDAYYHYPNRSLKFADGSSLNYSIIDCSKGPWVPGKPHVIYGYAVIDSGSILTIQPKVTVYMHNNAVLWVYKGASIQVNGSYQNEVVFQGDRLEQAYANIPGQWGKIWLSAGSYNNNVQWSVIKNASIGIQADSINGNNYALQVPTLSLSHTIITNASIAGLYAIDSKIRASNCLFENCGQYQGAFLYGGWYTFNQCTFADYGNGSFSQQGTPAVYLNNWYKAGNGSMVSHPLDSALFVNCIIYGNQANEIGLDSSLNAKFNYKFKNSLLQIDNTFPYKSTYHIDSVFIGMDPLFNNQYLFNFNLMAGSPAIGKGSPTCGVFYGTDLNNNPRPALPTNRYDIGCYQFK